MNVIASVLSGLCVSYILCEFGMPDYLRIVVSPVSACLVSIGLYRWKER